MRMDLIYYKSFDRLNWVFISSKTERISNLKNQKKYKKQLGFLKMKLKAQEEYKMFLS